MSDFYKLLQEASQLKTLDVEQIQEILSDDHICDAFPDATLEEVTIDDSNGYISIFMNFYDFNRNGFAGEANLVIDKSKLASTNSRGSDDGIIEYTDFCVYKLKDLPIVIDESCSMGSHSDEECDATARVNVYLLESDEQADAFFEKNKDNVILNEMQDQFNKFSRIFNKLEKHLSDEQKVRFLSDNFKSAAVDKVVALAESSKLNAAIGEQPMSNNEHLGF